MKFYFEKIKALKKHKKLSTNEVCKKLEITRATLWNWETGKKTPTESKVRALSKAIECSVDAISDLIPEPPASNANVTEISKVCIELMSNSHEQQDSFINDIHDKINNLNIKLKRSSLIIRSIFSAMHSIFYIRDINLKYVVANKAFLKNLSLKEYYNVLGKDDKDFFSIREATKNTEQDNQVLISGKPIIDIEDYIPGTRKKRWGLTSKLPIYGIDNKLAGIIGIYFDITERKEVESQRKLLESAVNKIEDCIWIANIDERNRVKIKYINDNYEKITGIKKEDIINNPELKNKFIPIEDQKQFGLFRNNIEAKQVTYEYRIFNKNDNKEHAVKEIIYQYEKKQIMGILTDITEEKNKKNIEALNTKKIAAKMKNEKLDVKIISSCTGLTTKEINELG